MKLSTKKAEKEHKNLSTEEQSLQEDLNWLSVMRDMVSPYWAARVVAHPLTGKQMLTVEGLRKQADRVS